MNLLRETVRRLRRAGGEDGITGLETAIILIAFVVVAAVFAFVVLSTGLFSSERGKEAVYAGLAKTRSTMTLSSGVIALANPGLTQVDTIEFDLTLAAGGDTVNLDPTATSNSTVISYIDAQNVIVDVNFTTVPIRGNANLLLEPGELLRVTIDLAAEGLTVGPNASFSLEVKPPTGSYLIIQRTVPPALVEVNNLN
ncbi:MAG TPA: archaellin/type IV pilin N-terminal domain-containing protein [Dehalococcoidia bacterium]|nr:archaellin/type IV pilin N-terminal domain-containing protein [Dehalococcoidia bacterium]